MSSGTIGYSWHTMCKDGQVFMWLTISTPGTMRTIWFEKKSIITDLLIQYGKLVDNFSHKSDVTSLQDPSRHVPTRPLSIFTIVFPLFPWYWAHVRLMCLLWIAFHIRRRPRPYVYFTVRDILFCRRFKPIESRVFIEIDSYKRTSPRGPEAKHLRPRRTPINGVYAAGRLSSHSPFSQMYVHAAAERSLSGTHMHLLFCRRFTSTDSYGRNSPRTTEE